MTETRPAEAPQDHASNEFLNALLRADTHEALNIGRRALRAGGAAHLFEQVIRPALTRVGDLWQANALTVAEEHVATAVAQTVVALLYAEFPWPASGPRALVTCVESEQHQFGARMAADLLALDGWEVIFVGASMTTDLVLAAVERFRPRLVACSVTLPEHMPKAEQLVAALRASNADCKIMIGGRGLRPWRGTAVPDAVATTAEEGVVEARAWKS